MIHLFVIFVLNRQVLRPKSNGAVPGPAVFRKSNLETANEDIARSKDTTLLEAVETSQLRFQGMKM